MTHVPIDVGGLCLIHVWCTRLNSYFAQLQPIPSLPLRTKQMLTFHARMSIVTDTLSRASTHLDHFLFVFFLVSPSTSVDWLFRAC